MNIKEQHIVTGMVTDMNVSRFDPTKVLYARNIRITQMEGNQGLLCVTNEKGTNQCIITGDAITGDIVGSALIKNYLVFFTHQENTDRIYRLEELTDSSFVSVKLFEGILGLSPDHPLETLPVYENENIQKVYWVDGIHQLRCINVADTEERAYQVSSTSGEETVFDSNPVINLHHQIQVTKRLGGGEFPAGTIQYAFTYYNLNGIETNVFEVTPLYELSPKTKGVAADGRVNCSFEIKITGLDDKYDYIRVYAITRTSANAAPNVRLVGDYPAKIIGPIETTQTPNGPSPIARIKITTVIDNGSVGETIDATKLLFIGGEPVAPATFTAKDNTLFLGNITLKRPSIGNLMVNDKTITDTFRDLVGDNDVPLQNKPSDDISVGSGDWFYDYIINNNRPSTSLRRFKRGETYRLGIIAQHETGIWSDVVWIGDYENTVVPQFYDKVQNAGIFTLTNENSEITAILEVLEANGFKRLAPVVVCPNGSDRSVFCQGLVSATVYNVEDRYSNRPFSQASWFFRPIAEGFGVAAIPHASLYSTHDQGTPSKGQAEIQINTNPRNYLPQVEGYWGQSGTKARIPAGDMVAMFGNDYYVDTSIVTLNSPDIELDDSLQQEDFDDLKFRIVGVAKSSSQNIIANTYADITAGRSSGDRFLDMAMSRVEVWDEGPIGKYFFMDNFPSFPGYLLTNYPIEQNYIIDVPFIIYPWHKTGSITGKDTYNDSDYTEFAVLNHKVLSSFWFAHTELFNDITSIGTDKIKLFDDTQSDFIPLGETADSNVYYGNVDSVRIHKKDNLSVANISHVNEVFNMSEPELEGSFAEFESAERGPSETDYYGLLSTHAINNPDANDQLPNSHNGSIEEILQSYGTERMRLNLGIGTTIYFSPVANHPVPIKYKSTRHAVIPLSHTEFEIPSLYRSEAVNNAYLQRTGNPVNTTIRPFWDENNEYTLTPGKVKFGSEWDPAYNAHRMWSVKKDSYKSLNSEIPTLYIGELYRTVSKTVRFGGQSEEAIVKNVWNRCGSAIQIDTFKGGNVELVFEEGDTYLARYDCLKTYPYTDNDVNSIVEIFSTDLETRVNLDARYDNARALIDNTLVRPTNINLVNRLGFEQENNFFTYSALDPQRENIDRFPNLVAISGEKTMGEEVDTWMQQNLLNTQDLEGTYGEIEALRTYNNDVFVFQNNAFGQILFNNRVQIPTSDGQPIEITNGMKLQGVRYLSNKIGCSNKWSIVQSNSRLYWYDSDTQDIWSFSGQGMDNLSTRLGVKGWLSDVSEDKWSVSNMAPMRSLHDEKYNDVYFMVSDPVKKNEDIEHYGSLVYSETLDSFVSVMDYAQLENMFNLNGRTLIVDKENMHGLWEGQYNTFFGVNKPYILRFIANAQPNTHKVFDTVQWRSDTWNTVDKYLPRETFNKLQVWNQYQQSEKITLTDTPGKPSPLKKKFNTFRALVPRDKQGDQRTDVDYTYKRFSRIRGNYAVVELTHDIEDINKMQFYDLEISEFL